MTRNTFAEINLQAVIHNFNTLRQLAPESKPLAVVKADAYGNGANRVAAALQPLTSMFGVAIYEEAVALRNAGITKPILVLQGPLAAEQLQATKSDDIHWMLHNPLQLEWFRAERSKNELNGHQWIKFDTGMHRLGFMPSEYSWLKTEYSDIFTADAVIATHLACADDEFPAHSQSQINQFLSLVQESGNPTSIANSAGTIAFADARSTYNRLGIAVYGSSPFKQEKITLEPVMRFCAPVIAIREIPAGDTVGYGATWEAKRKSRIATVAVGYADGYPRHAPSGTPAWLNGQVIPLAGRVSMDMLTFDVTDLENVHIGDLVELWGPNNPINDVASIVKTIGYELMTRVSQRVPRRYVSM